MAVGLWATSAGATVLTSGRFPLTKADCKDGGWANFGTLFANQGQCVSAAEHDAVITVGNGVYGITANHNATVLSVA